MRTLNKKLTKAQARRVYRMAKRREKSQTEIGRLFGVSQSTVRNILIGKCYRDATEAA